MHIRRLVKAGPASHTVSLPKDWLEKNNLKKGDTVYILEKSDRELSILPTISGEENKPQKEKTIEIDGKDIDTIQREITSAYLNNYGTITLVGAHLAGKAKEIRRILHDFVALEISEQTGKQIIARDLLNLKEISFEKTLRRMDMIVRNMLQDSLEILDGKNLHESIILRDYDVNRLYFLLFKLIKRSLSDSEISESFGITPKTAISGWSLTMNLENIADCGKNLSKAFKKLGKKSDFKGLKEIYSSINSSYAEVMKAYFTNDKKLADSIARKRTAFFEKCSQYLAKHNEPVVAETMETMKAMTTLINNIARLVIDGED